MSDQPRTEDGRFTVARLDKTENANRAETVAELNDEYLSDSVEFVRVNKKFLEEALERAGDDPVVDFAVASDKMFDWGALFVRKDNNTSVVVAGMDKGAIE